MFRKSTTTTTEGNGATAKLESAHSQTISSLAHSPKQVKVIISKAEREKVLRKVKQKTSDYSSDDGDYEVTSSGVLDQNSRNQLLEEAQTGSSRVYSGSSALDLYRNAVEYWK